MNDEGAKQDVGTWTQIYPPSATPLDRDYYADSIEVEQASGALRFKAAGRVVGKPSIRAVVDEFWAKELGAERVLSLQPPVRHLEAMKHCSRVINHLTRELLKGAVVHVDNGEPCAHDQASGPMCINPLHLEAAGVPSPQPPVDLEPIKERIKELRGWPSFTHYADAAAFEALVAEVERLRIVRGNA